MKNQVKVASLLVACGVLFGSPMLVAAQSKPGPEPSATRAKGPTFGADFRYRFEQDWDSRNDDGSNRKDRFRMRYRLRFGLTYAMDKYFTFGARVRSGVPENMGSPHVNVGYNSFTSQPFNIDKAYVSGKYRGFWFWAGKNSYPLWKQNELFWDDDINPEGLAVGASFSRGNLRVRPTAAYFVANHEQVLTVSDARIGVGQIAATVKVSDKLTVDGATGYLHMDQLFDKPHHLGGMQRQDYKFIVTGIRATVQLTKPVVVGFDHFVNVADYDDVDHIPDHYKDQKNGFVVHVHMGATKQPGDWLAGYYFAYKQKYSVVDYFTEDDWVRWGNIDRNRNSNYSGHELRLAYVIAKNFNAVLRGYMVEGLVARKEKNPNAVTETGSRVRLDINLKF